MNQLSGIVNSYSSKMMDANAKYSQELSKSEAEKRDREGIEVPVGMELLQLGLSSGRLGAIGKHLVKASGIGDRLMKHLNGTDAARIIKNPKAGEPSSMIHRIVKHFATKSARAIAERSGLVQVGEGTVVGEADPLRSHFDNLFGADVSESLHSAIRENFSGPEEAARALSGGLQSGASSRWSQFKDWATTKRSQVESYRPTWLRGGIQKNAMTDAMDKVTGSAQSFAEEASERMPGASVRQSSVYGPRGGVPTSFTQSDSVLDISPPSISNRFSLPEMDVAGLSKADSTLGSWGNRLHEAAAPFRTKLKSLFTKTGSATVGSRGSLQSGGGSAVISRADIPSSFEEALGAFQAAPQEKIAAAITRATPPPAFLRTPGQEQQLASESRRVAMAAAPPREGAYAGPRALAPLPEPVELPSARSLPTLPEYEPIIEE